VIFKKQLIKDLFYYWSKNLLLVMPFNTLVIITKVTYLGSCGKTGEMGDFEIELSNNKIIGKEVPKYIVIRDENNKRKERIENPEYLCLMEKTIN
jgi:hypothetical protein